jgi:hypothetical protein
MTLRICEFLENWCHEILCSHFHISWPIWETFLIENSQVTALRICEFCENWCYEIDVDLAVQIVG